MTTASILTPCQRFFQHAFNLLIERAQTCIRHANQRAAEPTATPKQLRAPDRANTTMDWIIALARTLAGDRKYRLTSPSPARTQRAKPAHAAPRPTHKPFSLRDTLRRLGCLPPKPTSTEESRALARLHYMKKVFATQPTGIIAARLARRAGIKKTSDYWPIDLIAITQTPVQWADENPPEPDPRDEPHDEPHGEPGAQSIRSAPFEAPCNAPQPAPQDVPSKPSFYRRE
jgi:hypothetical protein